MESAAIHRKETREGCPVIDWNKPYRTKGGAPVRVLCTDRKGEHPVVALVTQDGEERLAKYSMDGVMKQHGARNVGDVFDIVNAPEEKEVWVAIFPGGNIGAFRTESAARKAQGWSALKCVRYTEGDCDGGPGDLLPGPPFTKR